MLTSAASSAGASSAGGSPSSAAGASGAISSAGASSPGALSVSVGLAASGFGDLRYVTVLQSLRLMLITICLPPLIGYAEVTPGASPPGDGLTLMQGALLLAGAIITGLVFERIKAPAPWLLAGLLVSGVTHGVGLVTGRLPDWVMFLGFAIAGAVIGARFAGVTLAELRRLGLAGLAATSVAIGIAALMGALVAAVSGLPFAQIWIAYAPGGVEGMAAMALALGYDPVFVATHHIFRIIVLIIVLPLLLRGMSKGTT